MCTVVTFSGSFWRTWGRVTRGRFYSKNLHAVFTLVVTLCAAQRARWSSIRGETARDRKFGRPRTGRARARRGVTRDGAGKRRCKLIHYFRYILFSETLVLAWKKHYNGISGWNSVFFHRCHIKNTLFFVNFYLFIANFEVFPKKSVFCSYLFIGLKYTIVLGWHIQRNWWLYIVYNVKLESTLYIQRTYLISRTSI